jgi:hypothetical protein
MHVVIHPSEGAFRRAGYVHRHVTICAAISDRRAEMMAAGEAWDAHGACEDDTVDPVGLAPHTHVVIVPWPPGLGSSGEGACQQGGAAGADEEGGGGRRPLRRRGVRGPATVAATPDGPEVPVESFEEEEVPRISVVPGISGCQVRGRRQRKVRSPPTHRSCLRLAPHHLSQAPGGSPGLWWCTTSFPNIH